MIRSLWTAATGMDAQQLTIDVIANNLANVNTPGFKRSRADFQDLLYQSLRTSGSSSASGIQTPTGSQVGLGTKNIAIQKNFSQGNYKQTDNPLDIVIEGEGFFQITQPNGSPAYTRAGTFKLDNVGNLVNSDGYSLEPAITIPEDTLTISIGSDGTVSAEDSNHAVTEIGNIVLYNFPNPAGLKSIGKNLYIETPSSGAQRTGVPGEDGFGTIGQGFLEMSNVQIVEEMVNMIIAQRAYETNAKSIQSADAMLQTANNLKR